MSTCGRPFAEDQPSLHGRRHSRRLRAIGHRRCPARSIRRWSVPRRWSYRDLKDASSDVTAVAVSATRQDIFVRNSRSICSSAGLSRGVWGGWINHGGILTSEPRPVSEPGGQVLVFVRGLDFGLWAIDVTCGSARDAGSSLERHPDLGSCAGFAEPGALRRVRRAGLIALSGTASWNGAAWSPWETLKGLLATGPVAASTGAGRIDIAALDDAGAAHSSQVRRHLWSEWRDLGGELHGRRLPRRRYSRPDRRLCARQG